MNLACCAKKTLEQSDHGVSSPEKFISTANNGETRRAGSTRELQVRGFLLVKGRVWNENVVFFPRLHQRRKTNLDAHSL